MLCGARVWPGLSLCRQAVLLLEDTDSGPSITHLSQAWEVAHLLTEPQPSAFPTTLFSKRIHNLFSSFWCVMSSRREMSRLPMLSPGSCRLSARIVTPLSLPGMRRIDLRCWIMINPVRLWSTVPVSGCWVKLVAQEAVCAALSGMATLLWISGCFSTWFRAVAKEKRANVSDYLNGSWRRENKRECACEWSVGSLVCFYFSALLAQSGCGCFFVLMEGVCCTVISTDFRVTVRLKVQCQADSGKRNYCIWLSVRRTTCNFLMPFRDTNVKLVILTEIWAHWISWDCKILIIALWLMRPQPPARLGQTYCKYHGVLL